MWIVGGNVVAIVHSFEPLIDYPKKNWNHFAVFARYPQGLPLGIDRSRLQMKPFADGTDLVF